LPLYFDAIFVRPLNFAIFIFHALIADFADAADYFRLMPPLRFAADAADYYYDAVFPRCY